MIRDCQLRFAVLGLLLLLLLGSGSRTLVEGQSLEPAGDLSVSCLSVPGLVASDAGFEHFVNPVLFTLPEAADTIEEFERTRDCLVQVSAESDRALTARAYLDLFLDFLEPSLGSESNRSLEVVDLATTDDPGIRRIRDEVGLPAPIGIIFVRYFSQAEQMPSTVRRAFDNPQAQAVTIGTRYIAVLTPVPRTVVQREMLDDALEATFSHELIHAFLNARLGSAIFETGFPTWFHEGMAIHFSGSGQGHVAIDNSVGTIFKIEPTVEYEQYERVFRYLEDQLGTNDFHAALRAAVNEANPSVLLTQAGFDSYEGLSAQAELWWRWRPIPVVFLVAPQLWGFLLFVGLGAAVCWRIWRRWQPAVPGSALEVGVNADLFEAVKSANDDTVVYLLRSGAEPNAEDGEGWTALRWAVFFNRASSVETLLGAGAEPSHELLVFADSRDTMPEIIRLLADALGSFDDETL
jgi:hypothetical protein